MVIGSGRRTSIAAIYANRATRLRGVVGFDAVPMVAVEQLAVSRGV
jgi:hypothetical protein